MRPLALLLLLVCCQAAHGQATIFIEASAPGYTPGNVERTVLAPLEDYLDNMGGVQHMRGLAVDGKCVIQLDLSAKADRDLAGTMVQNRLALAKSRLPPICATKILPATDRAFMLLSLEPGPDMSLFDVGKWARKTVWPRLASVPGVASIHPIGAPDPTLRILLDPDRLRAYNLTAADVAAIIQDSRKGFDGLSFNGKKLTLPEKPADLANIPIRPEKSIYLRDVASVPMADEVRQDASIFRRGGKSFTMRRAVFVVVEMAPGKFQAGAKQGLEKVVAKLRTTAPDGMWIEPRLLQPDDTAVVMHLSEKIDGERGREEKSLAAVKAMMEVPQVDSVFRITQPDERDVLFYVQADVAKQADLRHALRAKLAMIEGTRSRVGGLVSPLHSWPGQGAQFVVRLEGKDREKLRKTAELLGTRLAKTPGLVDIDQFPKMRQEWTVNIDRERMGLAGVQPADIANALRTQDWPVFGWPWPITLSVAKAQAQTAEEMGVLVVRSNGDRPATLLRDVATIRTVAAPNGVLHEAGGPCVIVFGNVHGRTPEQAGADLRRLAQELAGNGIDVFVECADSKTKHQGPTQPVPANKKEPPGRASEPTPVTTVTPRRITLTRRIEQSGSLQAFESTPIYSKIAGFAEDWRVDLGDRVKKGELLVKLFIPEVAQELKVKETRVKHAEAELKSAKENVLAATAAEDAARARIAQAETEVERWLGEVAHAKKLLKDGKSDQATVDRSVNRWKESTAAKVACDAEWREKSALRAARQARVEAAEAQIQVARETYQQWKAWMAYAEIRAPYDGIITLRNVAKGDFVLPPTSGSANRPPEPLFVIKRFDIMRVVVQVPELDAPAVKKGDKASFSLSALRGPDLTGTVTRRSSALDVDSRTLRVECDLPNADNKLLPGMYIRATIIAKIDNAVVLPPAAIMNDILADADLRYCFQVVKGVARRINVEVGYSGDEGVQVLRKQEPGSNRWVNFSGQEVIITNPANLVDGQAVAPMMAEPKKKE